MAKIELISVGKDTKKYYIVSVKDTVSTGLFGSKLVNYKMKIILYKETEFKDLQSIVDEILEGRDNWRPSKNGGFFFRIPFVCSCFVANDAGAFATKGKKSE